MCVNCNDSLQVNLPIGPAGENGVDGQSAYLYVASASALPATSGNFSYPLDPADNYISVLNTTSPITTVNFNNFITNPNFTGWHNWQGPTGSTGPVGPTGPIGPFGGVTFEYNFLGFTGSVSAPGNGNLGVYYLGFLPTTLYISNQDSNGGLLTSYFSYITNISSASKAAVRIAKKTDPTAYQIYKIVSGTNNGAYYSFTLTPSSLAYGSTPLQLNDDVLVSFSAVGDKGDSVVTTVESAGANCTLGGLKVEVISGVTGLPISTSYVCKVDNIATGIVNWFAGTSAPSGYLVCDGSAVSTTTYAALYSVIGTTYNTFGGAVAPGAGLFRVPDLRGLFIRGAGTSIYDPNSPRAVGDFQPDAIIDHTHSYANYPNQNGPQGSLSSGTDATLNDVSTSQTTGGINSLIAISNETRPVNVTLLPCIKF